MKICSADEAKVKILVTGVLVILIVMLSGLLNQAYYKIFMIIFFRELKAILFGYLIAVDISDGKNG
jgi:hypothetical protein